MHTMFCIVDLCSQAADTCYRDNYSLLCNFCHYLSIIKQTRNSQKLKMNFVYKDISQEMYAEFIVDHYEQYIILG